MPENSKNHFWKSKTRVGYLGTFVNRSLMVLPPIRISTLVKLGIPLAFGGSETTRTLRESTGGGEGHASTTLELSRQEVKRKSCRSIELVERGRGLTTSVSWDWPCPLDLNLRCLLFKHFKVCSSGWCKQLVSLFPSFSSPIHHCSGLLLSNVWG